VRHEILLGCRVLAAAACLVRSARAQIVTENAGTISPETPILHGRFGRLETARVTDGSLVQILLVAPDETTDFGLALPLVHRHVVGGGSGTFQEPGAATLRRRSRPIGVVG